MILDALQRFDDNSSLAIAAGTQASANILDYGILSGIPSSASGGGARDMGIGKKLPLLVQVGTTFTGGTSLQVAIQGAPDNASGAPGTFVTWYSSYAVLLASLNAGSRILEMDFPRPPDGVVVPRFVRLLYTVVGTMTAGTVSAFVTLNRDDQMYNSTDNSVLGGYPAGINIAN